MHTERAYAESKSHGCDRKLAKAEKTQLKSSVSAINTGAFGMGAICGPILASILMVFLNYEGAFTSIATLVFLLSFLHLISQFCYTRPQKQTLNKRDKKLLDEQSKHEDALLPPV